MGCVRSSRHWLAQVPVPDSPAQKRQQPPEAPLPPRLEAESFEILKIATSRLGDHAKENMKKTTVILLNLIDAMDACACACAKEARRKRMHTPECKREAVRLFNARGNTTVDDLGSSLGLAPCLLYRWRKELGGAPEPSSNGESLEEEARRQRIEMARLRDENTMLKKSIALFVK